MEEKYKSAGLNLNIILEAFPDLNEYEDTVNAYLCDEHFNDLGEFLNDEDYEMAKDTVKGLYLLAQDLRLFPLYETLLEVYEDLSYETYDDILIHYTDMMFIHHKIQNIFKN